ncbi:hypothetical protein BAUCODRAFT_74704 [Baudoinia panamericana UAMH 10762]|uniref:Uncharacterized protein n=1 Tax=Baudoinia panamericana (strain UAMH 10762) TaxID=717646 RepID=M2N4Z4_BAUPA|nr:uncharacterized protein BAUCODRAFT_74704 [Baudoinia panamericana UAMH 10762]EMC94089.1 hypothetical protein BAUCODRAFT_74704 [Baudoinia panamericana UAMH 10762]
MFITFLLTSVFSTFFSGLFLVVSIRKPRYGKMISSDGSLTASSAALLTTALAKLTEASFATVFVAFLGQIFAHRAYKHVHGVTLAELSLRSWIVLPGKIFMESEIARFAGFSFLGVGSLLAALCVVLYTQAATALVQPQLQWDNAQLQIMQGLVRTQFANSSYINEYCETPISSSYDPDEAASTCIQIYHAAEAYHNYYGYLSAWKEVVQTGNGSSEPAKRPQGYAVINDDTTVTQAWIEQSNVTALYEQHKIIVNNVSMAVPHPGLIQAASDGVNGILQPAELAGLGSYTIRASVASPVIHSLCVTMTEAQLKPFVFELWDNVTLPVNLTIWPKQLSYANPYLGGTPFDDIFGWGPEYGDGKYPPVFGKVPIDYNTIINNTLDMPYGRDSIYLLGKGGPKDSAGNVVESSNYALCQLKVGQTPSCSTLFTASASGAELVARCEDPSDAMSYGSNHPGALGGNDTISLAWPDVATQWANSLALNEGLFDGNGSNARLLTQLILTEPTLNPDLPSAAEALAVMAGCTVLQSAIDAPFTELLNYTSHPTLKPRSYGSGYGSGYGNSSSYYGSYQSFPAMVRAREYASGPTQKYQNAFYPILILTFLLNLMVLLFLLFQRHWYNDFTDPTHLFSLAINSPPSKEMAGSCGGGPVGRQFEVSWQLNVDGDEHVYLEALDRVHAETGALRRRSWKDDVSMLMSPVKRLTGSERFEGGSTRRAGG